MHQLISSQTIDAPSWDLIRSAKLAARIYVPLGTSMSLGDFVRVMRTFVEAFKLSGSKGEKSDQQKKEDDDINGLRDDLKVTCASLQKYSRLLGSAAVSRQACILGHQGRPHPTTVTPAYDNIPDAHPSCLVPLSDIHIRPRTYAVDAGLRHDLLCCTQFQEERAHLGYVG